MLFEHVVSTSCFKLLKLTFLAMLIDFIVMESYCLCVFDQWKISSSNTTLCAYSLPASSSA